MSPPGASRGSSASPYLAAAIRLLAALCTLAGTSLAAPSGPSAPAVMVDAFQYALGDTLSVSGSGLEPGADYVVTFTPPSGEARASSAVADQAGALTVTSALDEPGDWTVSLTGPRIAASLGVQVMGGAEPPAPVETDDEPVPPVPAPEEDRAEPDPDEPAPEDELPEEEAPPAAGPGASPQRPGALPGEPQVPPAQARGEIAVTIEMGDVVGRRSGVEAWRLTFGQGSGETAGLLQGEGEVLVGRGNHLLQVDPVTGTVLARDRLPAQVVNIDSGPASLAVTVRHADGTTETLPWPPERPLAFDPDPALYGWLRAEASVSDPVAQLSRDPTNPWLYLAAARQQPDRGDTLRRNALSRARTFYEYAQLAQAFLAGPPRDEALATQAMDAALLDFIERGYRGTLLLDPELTAAYGFPHASLASALRSGDEQAADFWAPWLYRLSGDGGAEVQGLLSEYAALVQARGDQDAAQTWRERAALTGRADPLTTLERAATAVGNTGWYGVLALFVALVALRLTLLAKYWRAQTLTLRQRQERGQAVSRFSRVLTLRYATFTEKLVVVLLFAAMVAVAALSGWVGSTGEPPQALGSGSLAHPTSRALLAAAPDNADSAFIRAFAAQSAGDTEAAAAGYRELSDDADAMNNLGVLRGDPELFRLALELRPGHPVAAFNLGEGPNPSRLMMAYRPDAPLLVPPQPGRLARALSGGPWESLGAAFTNPFAALTELRPFQPHWLWTAAVVLFLAWAAWTVLSIFAPRPAAARNAPRTFLYHALALLLPGSGLADELWGVLLLVPWAIFGIDLLLHLTDLGVAPALAFDTDVVVLVVIYLLNTVAFAVEYASYRRRMSELRAEHPELAAAYGLRP